MGKSVLNTWPGGFLDLFKALLGKNEPGRFRVFTDPLGNFELAYPEDWHSDSEIFVEGGRYTVTFSSRNNETSFVVAVDAALPKNFDFKTHVKTELEGPSSGIHATVVQVKFRNLPAARREYVYSNAGSQYFGGGLMVYTGKLVFSLSWSAPMKTREEFEAMLIRLLDGFVFK